MEIDQQEVENIEKERLNIENMFHIEKKYEKDKKRGLCSKLAIENEDAKIKIDNFLQKMKKYNIFIVPCGELEDWVGCIKNKETCSPEIILQKYSKQCNTTYSSLTNFIKEVAEKIKVD